MTSRALIEVEADDLERVAHRYGLDITLTADRAYLHLGDLVFSAPLEPVGAVAS